MIAVIVLLFIFFFGRTNKKIVPIYMNGVNEGDNLSFKNAFQGPTEVGLRNWYMESYFGEVKMNVIGCVATAVLEVAWLQDRQVLLFSAQVQYRRLWTLLM